MKVQVKAVPITRAEEIPDAAFYDCREAEEYHCQSPEEALEELLDEWMEPDCDVAAFIKENAPYTICCYNPRKLEESFVKNAAAQALEWLAQHFDDEYGVDYYHNTSWATVRKEFEPAMEKLLHEFFSKAKIWQCEEVGRFELGAELVEKMMREYRPDWFEKEGDTDGEAKRTLPEETGSGGEEA